MIVICTIYATEEGRRERRERERDKDRKNISIEECTIQRKISRAINFTNFMILI